MATLVHVSNDVKRTQDVMESLSADITLTHADSGKKFLLDAIGEQITLPALKAGVNYKFICDTTTVTTNWTITGGVSKIQGSAEVAGAIVAAANETTITLVIAKFLPGDFVELDCDGVNWYVSGEVVTAAGCTFA